MMDSSHDRRLAAVLSADVVGYSRLISADEDGTVRTLAAYREQVSVLLEQHRGRLVDFTGDNFLAEFRSALEAVRCAVEIQRVLEARNAALPEDRKLRFRIGAHLGDIREEDGHLYGDGINIAARLEALAAPGGICVSDAVYAQVRSKLDPPVIDLGDQELKNIPHPVRAYALGSAPARVMPAPPPAHKRLPVWPLLIALAAVVVMFVYLRTREPVPTAPPAAPVDQGALAAPPQEQAGEKPSIAVLPFDNLSGDAEQEYFVDGMTEDLITDLAKINGLLVIARNSVFVYKDQAVDVQQVARDLNVQYVLEGSVRRAGDRVRINAQLIEGETGHHLWSERYDREMTEVFALQDDVTEAIVSALRVTLSPDERTRVTQVPTRSPDAYDLYLRARAAAFYGSRDSLNTADALLAEATDLDPAFAEAHGFQAAALIMRRLNQWSWDPALLDTATQLAEHALSLNPDLGVLHAVLAFTQLQRRDYDGAERSAQRARAVDPGSADVLELTALVLLGLGRNEDALAALDSATRLDPVRRPWLGLVYAPAYANLGDADRALMHAREFVAQHSGHPAGRVLLARILWDQGDVEGARREAQEALRLNPDFTVSGYMEALPYRDEGRRRELGEALKELGFPEGTPASAVPAS